MPTPSTRLFWGTAMEEAPVSFIPDPSDDQAGGSFADWTFQNVPASNANWRDGLD